MARPAQVAPRRQPGSAFGHSLRAWVLVCPSAVRQTVRLAAISLSRWISGATINIRGQRFEPSCGCPDPGALTMLDQPSNQSQDNSLPAAERRSAVGDQRAIVDDAFCL